ncbi:MAG: pitrilysin family protein [Planctomycetota bacterium]|nr:pitrilysin family protein [Planctomycetota bacterium]
MPQIDHVRTDRLSRERIHGYSLRCGMPLFVLKKAGFSKTLALISVNFGSIDSGGAGGRAPLPGLAHFLEHMLFKKRSHDISNDFAMHGASVNAGTDYVATTFYFTTSGPLAESLRLLTRLVFEGSFEKEIVEKERLIITQELLMSEDDPARKTYANLMDCVYHRHPARQDIAGTVDSVSRIDLPMLSRHHGEFYVPANTVAAVCGSVDIGEVHDLLDHAMSSVMRERSEGTANRRRISEPGSLFKEERRHRMETTRPRVLLGFKDSVGGTKGQDLVKRDIATSILLDYLFGKGSRDALHLYDSGLIDDSFAFASICQDTFGLTIVGGECDEPDRLVESVTAVARGNLKAGIKRRRIEMLKRKYLGRFIGSFDSPEGCAFAIASGHFKGVGLFDFPRLLSGITTRVVAERLEEHLVDKRPAVSIVLPKSEARDVKTCAEPVA